MFTSTCSKQKWLRELYRLFFVFSKPCGGIAKTANSQTVKETVPCRLFSFFFNINAIEVLLQLKTRHEMIHYSTFSMCYRKQIDIMQLKPNTQSIPIELVYKYKALINPVEIQQHYVWSTVATSKEFYTYFAFSIANQTCT